MNTTKLQIDEELRDASKSGQQTPGQILKAAVGDDQADGTFDGEKNKAGGEAAEDPENEGDDVTDEEDEEEVDPDSDKDKA